MKNCTGLYIIGHFYNHGGYADMAHQYAHACEIYGIPARLIPTGEEKSEVKSVWLEKVAKSESINLGDSPYVLIIDIPPRFRLVEVSGVSKFIGVTIFEGDTIPKEWINYCGLVDEIWVPTQFNLDSFERGGINRSLMRKIPLSVDVNFWDLANKGNKKIEDRTISDRVEFLYCCSLHKRKGLDKLLPAYFSEFSEKNNVRLTISCFPIKSGGLSDRGIHDNESLENYLKSLGVRFGDRKENYPALRAYLKYWSNEDLREIFFQSDAYMSTERADGWGLPVMQMMALEKPVGLLSWGGSTEYSGVKNAYLINPGPLIPVDCTLSKNTPWYRGQAWPTLSVKKIRECMRGIFNDVVNGNNAKGIAASKMVRSEYSYQKLGKRIAEATNFRPVLNGSNSGAKVILRELPYEGSWVHILISKVRKLLTSSEVLNIAILAPNEVAVGQFKNILLKQGLNAIVSNNIQSILGAYSKNTKKDISALIICESVSDCVMLDKKFSVFARIFLFDRVKMILTEQKLQNEHMCVKRQGIFLSGGLTENARKLLSGRGLLGASLFSYLVNDKSPGSWTQLKREEITDVLPSEFDTIFVGDEDWMLQRLSYQNAELVFEKCNIEFLCPSIKAGDDFSPLIDDEIYRKSIPKRWSRANSGELAEVVVIPVIFTKKQLANTLVRIAYFLSKKSGVNVSIAVSDNLLNISNHELNLLCADFCLETYGGLSSPIYEHINFISDKEAKKKISEINCLTVITSLENLSRHERILLNNSDDILLFDVDHKLMRSGFSAAYAEYYCKSRHYISKLRDSSKLRLSKLVFTLKKLKKDNVVIFGTGPSLASAFDIDFSSSVTIACNTMVKDELLLQHIKPDILVASDADFHFGPSRYAQSFRLDLCREILKYKCAFVCPEVHVPLLLSHCPEIEPFVIGVPVDGTNVNFDLLKEFRVRAIDNVLLQFMFPLAATLSNNVKLLGFDGRKMGDVKFWNHNLNTQYSDVMDTIEYSHPAFFFYRNYHDYFERHCDLIRDYVGCIENKGGKVVSLADSAVPALNERFHN